MTDKSKDQLEWQKVVDALKAMPEELRLFQVEFYERFTTDTGAICGCAIGQLSQHLWGSRNEAAFFSSRLKVDETIKNQIYRLNDGFANGEGTEEACRRRYEYVLAECERLAA